MSSTDEPIAIDRAQLVMLALLFSLEIWRTAAMRSGEGPGVGDFAPFVRSLVAL